MLTEICMPEKQPKDRLCESYLDMYQKSLSSSQESHLLEKVKNFFNEQRLDDPVPVCPEYEKSHYRLVRSSFN